MSDDATARTPVAPTPGSGDARPTQAPNYAARRMLVTTVAIMAIVAFAVVGWTVIRDDDGSTGGSAGSWNEIALISPVTGEITVIDGEGEPIRTVVGRGRVSDVHTIGDRMALVGTSQIVLEGGDEALAVPIERTNTVTPIHTAERLHLVVGTTSGGEVRIVDVVTGEILDVGAIADQTDPRLFAETIRWSADGRRFAVADAVFFRTIVVESESGTAGFFAAQPVALDNDLVATSQVISRQADVELFDRERTSQARVATEIPAGGLMIDDDLVMVATTGAVSRVPKGASEAERLGEVAVPSGATVTRVHPTADGTRLVVAGAVFQAVVDLDGRTLFTTTFTTPVEVDVPRPDWACLPVGGDETYHSIVSLETGEQIADLSGLEVTGVASDGCTVIGRRGDLTEVVTAEGTVPLGRALAASLGPDGRTVVRTTVAGTTELLRIGDDLVIGEPVDLAEVAPRNPIVAFLDSSR
ncbi:hypothetical protein [Ilumatobacter sp.]|uniref:hypothetical protein n=1 Tax=Ilumatobacter sp. TaxID=1967498 RepID=UPI003AF8C6E9